jgi:hypothetical protein
MVTSLNSSLRWRTTSLAVQCQNSEVRALLDGPHDPQPAEQECWLPSDRLYRSLQWLSLPSCLPWSRQSRAMFMERTVPRTSPPGSQATHKPIDRYTRFRDWRLGQIWHSYSMTLSRLLDTMPITDVRLARSGLARLLPPVRACFIVSALGTSSALSCGTCHRAHQRRRSKGYARRRRIIGQSHARAHQ